MSWTHQKTKKKYTNEMYNMQIDIAGIATAVLVPVGRSVGGWMTNALKDGKITNFELKKLGETVLRTGIYGTLIFLGADGFGIELAPIAAGASAVILDMVLKAFKETKNVTKR